MIFRTLVSRRLTAPSLVCAFALCAFAQDPSSQPGGTIDPPAANGQKSIAVTITMNGSAIQATSQVTIVPPVITVTAPAGTPADQRIFTLKNSAAGTVNVMVDGKLAGVFDTGIQCLEATNASNCALRLEIDVTGVNGSTSQSSSNTTPNFVFKVDYQWKKNKDKKLQITNRLNEAVDRFQALDSAHPRLNLMALDTLSTTSLSSAQKTALDQIKAQRDQLVQHPQAGTGGFLNSLGTHVTFRTGYTQVSSATKLQPTQSGVTAGTSAAGTSATGGSASSTSSSTSSSCSASSSSSSSGSSSASSSSTCTAATQQQAFIAELGANIGLTLGRDGQGNFAEVGFGGRARFQDLVPTNQVVQSGGVSYVQLSSLNPHNASGLYEAVGRFRIGELDHDSPALNSGNYSNASDFLVFEAGFQDNSGMTQLASTPSINTRYRFVGRFTLTPELPGPSHTKVLIGMEYTKGITGGPGTIQVFFGPNVSLPKLLSSLSGKSNN